MKKAKAIRLLIIAVLCVALSLVIFVACDKPDDTPKYSAAFETNGGSAVDALADVTQVAEAPQTTRPGYTFGGWYAAEDLSGEAVTFPLTLNADTTLYAKWTANEYTITFDYGIAEGGFGDDNRSVVFGEALGELPSPTAPGCDFSGWYKGDAAVNAETIYSWAEDVTLTAAFAGAEYTVTFDYALPEGQTLVGGETQSKAVVFGETIGELPAPTCEGFDLVGWFAGETQYNADSAYNIPSDRTFTAKWSKKVFDVVIHANGGTYTVDGAPVDKIEGKAEYDLSWAFFSNSLISEGKDPFSVTRTGYKLTGFYTNPECTGDPIETLNASPNHYHFTQSIELYAGWEMIEYTVRFLAYLPSGRPLQVNIPSITGVSIGDTITVPEYPADTTPGYDFFGWYSTYGESLPENPEYLPAGETEITAEFIENYGQRSAGQLSILAVVEAKQTVVTLDVNGGVLPEGASSEITVSYNEGGSFPVPTKENYIFDGWYLNLGEEGETRMTNIYGNSIGKWQRTEPTLTLKAKWVGQPQTLTFDYAGATSGNTETTRTVNAEAALGTLPVPVKTGHIFGGWFSGEVEYTAASIMPNSALTLTAKWTIGTYTITYDLGGGELPAGAATTKTATYGQAIGELPTPTKTDAVFGGWTVGGSTTVITAETLYTWGTDQVFYATWSDDIYTKGINYIFVPAAEGIPAYYKIGTGDLNAASDAYVGDTLQEVILAPTYDDGVNGVAPVKEISNYAFYRKKAMTSVSIPDSVTTIGAQAFSSSGLESCTIPATVTWLGGAVFSSCTQLVSLVIEGGADTSDYIVQQFNNCSALIEVTLPAFASWTTLPNSVESLQRVIITGEGDYFSSNGIVYQKTEGGSEAKNLIFIPISYYKQVSGTVFEIPAGTIGVEGNSANSNAMSPFTEVKIPASVTSFLMKGGTTFLQPYGESLTKYTVDTNNATYCDINGVLYSKDKTRLISVPFGYTGELNIPAETTVFTFALTSSNLDQIIGLTKINLAAPTASYKTVDGILWKPDDTEIIFIPKVYVGQINLKAATTSIYSTMIAGVTGYTVEDGNTSFKAIDGVLYNAAGTSVYAFPGAFTGTWTVPASCTNIGYNFPQGLTAFAVEEGNTAFAAFNGALYDVNLTAIKRVALGFSGVLTLPSTFAALSSNPFQNYKGITGFAIEGSEIYRCVDGVLYLTSDGGTTWKLVAYPGGKEGATFDMTASLGDSGLNVTAIGVVAFRQNETLTTVKVSAGVTTIGLNAFASMDNLTALYLLTDAYVTGGTILSVNNFTGKIYVPDQAAIDEYTNNAALKMTSYVAFMEIAPQTP